MPRPAPQSLPATDDLIRFVDRWQRKLILVAGDFMLDRLTYGNADRLSPDAPVPVLAVKKEESQPGGSSNVAMDIRALRCDVACLGVVGDDRAGVELQEMLDAVGCDVTGIVTCEDRPTTVKHSIVGLAQHRHPQKMFRIDSEVKTAIDAKTQALILGHAKRLMKKAAVLCLEDYNKGVLTPALCRKLIQLAKKSRVPVLVDPASISDYTKYKGATSITPNRTEAALATGRSVGDCHDEETLAKVAVELLKSVDLQTVVLTLDKQGAMLLEKKGKPVMVPTQARQVYDVTGAGDEVLAMLACAIANGAGWLTAVELANCAAGLEVEKFGCVPIELDEVLLSLLRRKHEELGKQRDLPALLVELRAHKSAGKKIAFTNGCFDILHAGHVSYLRAARRKGDLLVVGLNSDASIKRIKGPTRPVNNEADRVMVLSELQSVDYVIVFDDDTPTELIRAIKPDVLVKGADYAKDQVVGWEIVESYGGRVELVDLVKGRSTTNIIRKISGGAG
jgi:D-beta-D-heptose 7-phosphate kinase/D-beta-D-heptose 1-phosphate adenosyltransferase